MSILRAMGGLRDILVHGYGALDPYKILKSSKRMGSDALRFAEMLMAAVEARGPVCLVKRRR